MLIRTAVAAAAVAAAFTTATPPARADFAIMMAHNYEIVMPGMRKHQAGRQVPVRQVIDGLSRRGYHDFRVLTSPRGVYRILAHRQGRAWVITAGRRDGRIMAVNRA